MRHRAWIVLVVGLGCSSGDDGGDDGGAGDVGGDDAGDVGDVGDAGEDADGGEVGPPPTGQCGPEHAWLPAGTMGDIVDFELVDSWSLTAGALNVALVLAGMEVLTPVEYGVQAYRVRYVSQDRGVRVETTAVLSFPVMDEPEDVPIVLWTHGTTGFTDACAPSAGDIEDVVANVLFSGHGMAVAAPDYFGMNGFGDPAGFLHPYMVPEPTAVASIDSLRALLKLAEAEAITVRPDADRVLVWGGSEGGFAAVWADRYMPMYAPEFHVTAVAALVPPLDLLGLARHGVTVFGPTTGALAAALLTMNQWYGEPAPISEAITDDEPTRLASVLPGELAADCGDYPSVDSLTAVDQVYRADFIAAVTAGDWDAAEPFSCYLRNGTLALTDLPRHTDAPMLVVVSGADDLVVPGPQRAAVPVLCAQGYDIEYVECAGAGHTEGAVQSIPLQFEWMRARLAGEPLATRCVPTEPIDCSDLVEP